MTNHTKIICTIGPSVSTVEKMMELMEAGMNGARLNFSHGTHEEHLQAVQNLKEARRRLQKPLAIILDTKGPEIRIGKIKNGELMLPTGHRWLLVGEHIEGDLNRVTVTPAFILNELKVGMHVLFDDGYISSRIIEASPQGVLVEIENKGVIKSEKGSTFPMPT